MIEPPFQQLPPGWQSVLFSILAAGRKVLLAHPERCAHLAARPDLVEELIEAGVYLQVNWGSFLGIYGRTAKRTANILAWNGWIHCLGTDSHHPQNPFLDQIQPVASKLQAVIGEDNLRLLTVDNPLNVLRSQTVCAMAVTETMARKKKKPWWQLW